MSKESDIQTAAKHLNKEWNVLKTLHYKGDVFKENEKITLKYDVMGLIELFKYTLDDCGLQKSQHIIAHIAGFKNWKELLDSDSDSKKFATKLVKNIKTAQRLDEWNNYKDEVANFDSLDIEEKFSIFRLFQMNYNNYPIYDSDMDYLDFD